MSRLKETEIEDITANLAAYSQQLKAKTGCTLAEIAASAAGVDKAFAEAAAGKQLVGIVPVTSGEGILGGFSDTIAGILRFLGVRSFITGAQDVAGLAEAVRRGATSIFIADDPTCSLMDIKRGLVADNSYCTGRGFLTALAMKTGSLKGKTMGLLGAGPVGYGAAFCAVELGASVIVYDPDPKAYEKFSSLPAGSCRFAVTAQEAKAASDFLFEATPARGTITADDMSDGKIVAAPGVPLGVTKEAMDKYGDQVITDYLEIGVATMLYTILAGKTGAVPQNYPPTEKKPSFSCNHGALEELPPELAARGADFIPAYKECGPMLEAAKFIAEKEGSSVVKLPFCVTIEAEAMGAEVEYPDNGSLPAMKSFTDSVEGLSESIKNIDFSNGRIREVLKAIAAVREEGGRSILKVEAPFTILLLMAELTDVIKCHRSKPELLRKLLDRISENVESYIRQAAAAGADIISYADPSGAISLMGPELSAQCSGEVTMALLRRLYDSPPPEGCVIHLCGRTSSTLEELGLASFSSRIVEGHQSLNEYLLKAKCPGRVLVTGHDCALNIGIKKDELVVYTMDM